MKKTRKKGGSLNRKNNASNCKHYHLSSIRPVQDHYEFCDQDADYIDYPGGDKFYAPSDINGKIIERDWLEARFHDWQRQKEDWITYNENYKYPEYPNITTLEQFMFYKKLYEIPEYILKRIPDNPTFEDIKPFLERLNRGPLKLKTQLPNNYPDITTLEQFNVLRDLHKIPEYILNELPDDPTFEDIKPFLPQLNRINAVKRTRKLPDYRWKDLWDKSRNKRQGKEYVDSITLKPIKYNFWDLFDPEKPPLPKPVKKWW